MPRRAVPCHRVAVYRLDYDAEVMDDSMAGGGFTRTKTYQCV